MTALPAPTSGDVGAEPLTPETFLASALIGSDPFTYRAMILNDPCSYCDEPGGTADHVTPQAARRQRRRRFGDMKKDPAGNIVGCCERCNTDKGMLSLLRFLLSIPGAR